MRTFRGYLELDETHTENNVGSFDTYERTFASKIRLGHPDEVRSALPDLRRTPFEDILDENRKSNPVTENLLGLNRDLRCC